MSHSTHKRPKLQKEKSTSAKGSRSTGSPGRRLGCWVSRWPCPSSPMGEKTTKIKTTDEHQSPGDLLRPVEEVEPASPHPCISAVLPCRVASVPLQPVRPHRALCPHSRGLLQQPRRCRRSPWQHRYPAPQHSILPSPWKLKMQQRCQAGGVRNPSPPGVCGTRASRTHKPRSVSWSAATSPHGTGASAPPKAGEAAHSFKYHLPWHFICPDSETAASSYFHPSSRKCLDQLITNLLCN